MTEFQSEILARLSLGPRTAAQIAREMKITVRKATSCLHAMHNDALVTADANATDRNDKIVWRRAVPALAGFSAGVNNYRLVSSLRIPLTVQVSPQMEKHLKTLLASGLYGSSIEDVAERVLCEVLRGKRGLP